MSRLRHRPRAAEARENTIPLINIVFLLLIFFIVAGTLSPPRDKAVNLATAGAFDPAAIDPRMIYVTAAGEMRVGGAALEPAAAVEAALAEEIETLIVVPDRDLDATRFLAILSDLRTRTQVPIAIVTQRAATQEAS